MCAAIKGGRATVVRELIKLGADVNKQDNVRALPVPTAASSLSTRLVSPDVARWSVRRSRVCGAFQDGWTALHHAASDGDVVVVRALLEGGASRKIKNEFRSSQLFAHASACE